MKSKLSYVHWFLLLALLLGVALLLNLSLGSVPIPFKDTLTILIGGDAQKQSWQYILLDYRVPKALTAILVGGGLAISGVLMQTLFRNPLAGPFVLGISSGASLGAAVFIMGTSLFAGVATTQFSNDISLAVAASLGSFLVLAVVMVVANRVQDTMALLIIGLMFGSITAALVSVMAYFSDASALQRFVFWSFGAVGGLSWKQLGILSLLVLIGILLCIISLKHLNALLLGEHYAKSLGVPIKRMRYIIIVATGVLAGGITAFAGPIAFVGMAVPHLARQLFNTMDHKILIPAVFLLGAVVMLFCDTVAQLPNSAEVLPINAITSLVGAPVVIWLLINKRKLFF